MQSERRSGWTCPKSRRGDDTCMQAERRSERRSEATVRVHVCSERRSEAIVRVHVYSGRGDGTGWRYSRLPRPSAWRARAAWSARSPH